MGKLYPPYIEGTIPACTDSIIKVPFSLNRAVGKDEITSFIIKIKKTSDGTVILTKRSSSIDFNKLIATFSLTAAEYDKMQKGNFYKVQLACVNMEGETGYFSTLGIMKKTVTPIVSIQNLNKASTNIALHKYVGVYEQTQDPTEKMYSSEFILKDSEGTTIETSGIILHNIMLDTSKTISNEEYSFSTELNPSKKYSVIFKVTTVNGVSASSKYDIKENVTPEITLNAQVIAKNIFEEGIINIKLVSTDNKPASGNFALYRAASNEKNQWKHITNFVLDEEIPTKIIWRDFIIEHGVTYQYLIKQFNDVGIYSESLYSNKIFADFEDAFLMDGNRQLKIRFNPQLSGYKINIFEQKTDTIGSKYPFIFRNNIVNYHELTLSGLISYLMDDNELFISKSELGIQFDVTNLTSQNISTERIFKNLVLDWFNNGQIKMFKSPTEGSFIIRLLNNSLAPNQTVGRMLHTFSSTAVEIVNFSYENALKYKLVTRNEEYNSTVRNEFGTGEDTIETICCPIKQWYGGINRNIINEEENIKTKITNILLLRFRKRPEQPIFKKDDFYYTDLECTNKVDINSLDEIFIYPIMNVTNNNLYNGFWVAADGSSAGEMFSHEWIDGSTGTIFNESINPFSVVVNDSNITITNAELTLANTMPISSIIINEGIICEMSFEKEVIKFAYERNSLDIINAFNNYNNALNNLKEVQSEASKISFSTSYGRADEQTALQYNNKLNEAVKEVEIQYNKYIEKVEAVGGSI